MAEKNYGVEVHNINIDDIEALMTTEAAPNIIAAAKNTTPAYGATFTDAYTSNGTQHRNESGEFIVSKLYPSIYGEEAGRTINGTTTESGLDLSTARSSFITRANEKITNATSIHPRKTYYTIGNADFTLALGTKGNKTGNADIILLHGADTYYWVASRCIDLYSPSHCLYLVSGVYSGDIDAYGMFSSYDGSNGYALGLFPIVTISYGVIDGSNHTYTFTPIN